QMLTGSKSQRVTKLGLNRLSTYGMLGHLKSDEVAELIEGLVALDCVKQSGIDGAAQFRPVVRLTPVGAEVMRGERPLPADLPVGVALARKIRGLPTVSAEQPPPAVGPVLDEGDNQAGFYWTWRLLSAGFTPQECAAARRLPLQVIHQHARQAAEAGHQLEGGLEAGS
ncbi:MAG: RQC domain-containing protein, partial [Patescibacteria group bacterium]|nr:RQC domain-containing protein [Patescibacteria group bacterium]